MNFAANHYPGRVGPRGEWNYILDPQVEYPFPDVFEMYRCCLLRTLFSYNGLSADRGGADAQPDLASGSPIVSSDGPTWTIRITPGIIGSEQVACWAALDLFLMEQVVPWVPTVTFTNVWMFSRRVKSYSFDELTAAPALDRIRLSPA